MFDKIPTFAEDRDDAYFNSICPPEKLEAIRTAAQTAHDETFPARMARWEATYRKSVRDAAEKVAKSDRYEVVTRLARKAESIVNNDDEWVDGASEPEDVGIQVSPEVAVYRGVTTLWLNKNGYYHMKPGDPFGMWPNVEKRLRTDNNAAAQNRVHMDDEEFRYVRSKTALANGDMDATVLLRWNQPEDVLDELDAIDDAEERAVWTERMTAFRETQLRKLLRAYFESDRYMEREIVLKWTRTASGRWTPEEKMLVRDWVARMIEERGSRLAGFASCAGTIRQKMNRRDAKKYGESSFANVPTLRT